MQLYGQLFDQYYYAHYCGDPYERTDSWLAFFDQIAARIIADFNPKTVLDAGCALGFLVERLRARGVEAWGIDISEFAIQNVDASIKDYCSLGSIADPLPRKYDLIVSIEVLEHMPAADSDKAIENLSNYSDHLLISTSPYDYKEATHFNLQQPDYWARRFARFGFFHDVDYDGSYITPWSAHYQREAGSIQPVVQAYERKLWQLATEIRELRLAQIENSNRQQAFEKNRQEYQAKIDEQQKAAAELNQRLDEAQRSEEILQLEQRLAQSEARWEDLQKGRGWKLFQNLQALRLQVAPPGSSMERLLDRIIKRPH